MLQADGGINYTVSVISQHCQCGDVCLQGSPVHLAKHFYRHSTNTGGKTPHHNHPVYIKVLFNKSGDLL